MKMINALCFLIILSNTNVIAQQQLRLKERTVVPSTQRKVVSSFIESASGDFIRIFEQPVGTKRIEKGQFAGTDFMEKQSGLLLANGKEILLSKSEQVVSASTNQILTFTPNYNDNITQLNSYELKGSSMATLGQLRLNEIEVSPILLDNGLIILSDISEGYGTHIRIYSKEFDLINEYKPFNAGFARVIFSSSVNKVVCVFEGTENQIKICTMNKQGKLLSERMLLGKMRLQTIQEHDICLLLYGNDELVCADLNGEVIWKSSIALSNLNLVTDANEGLYLITKGQLVKKDLRTGIVSWFKIIEDLYSSTSQSSLNVDVRVTGIECIDETINVLLSTTNKGPQLVDDTKSDNKLIVLNRSGDLIQKLQLSQSARTLFLEKSGNGLKIIQDQEILSYEK